jgi:hypothetical protein
MKAIWYKPACKAQVLQEAGRRVILNIIDERTKPYRWRSVDVVIEPTWHDNTCADADQSAPQSDESDYEERAEISLSEAIAWAMGIGYPITLYLRNAGDNSN